MAKRLTILPNVREAYQKVYRKRRDLFLIFWLPVSLLVLLRIVLWQFPEMFSYLPNRAERGLLQAIKYGILAIPLVAALRLFILSEMPHLREVTLRRNPDHAPWLKFKFYISWGWRETYYAALTLSFVLFADLLGRIYPAWRIGKMKAENAVSIDLPWYDPLYYYVYIVWIVSTLLSSVFILWRPYIAVASKLELQRLRDLLKATQGNVLRIFGITALIFAPYFFINQVSGFAMAGIYFLMAKASQVMPFEAGLILSELVQFIFYVCLVAHAAFAANIWKSGLIKLPSAQ